MTAEPRGHGRILAAALAIAALIGVGAITAGLVLLLDPGTPEVIGPAGDTSAADTTDTADIAEPGSGADRASAEAAPLTLPKSPPKRVRIPKIKVDAPVRSLGLDKDGWLEVPPLNRPNLTGWYRLGPTPGQLGPAVIVGHVNSKAGPAVFARLHTLAKGDTVEVKREDGRVAVFRVDEVQRVDKHAFPTARVYGNLPHAGLRLITCGGAFDPKSGTYEDNIIVYATLTDVR